LSEPIAVLPVQRTSGTCTNGAPYRSSFTSSYLVKVIE
jgi:hypothetical protein